MEEQLQVSKNVDARGYRQGWSEEQFAARQVAKLQEEIAEIAKHFHFIVAQDYDLLSSGIDQAGQVARDRFDDGSAWKWAGVVGDTEELKKEIADAQVVIFSLAESVGRLQGEPFDVAQAAVNKSGKDRRRGVR